MKAIEELLQTVAALRDPDAGCPWDIEQNHQSLAKCLIDECCELLQTIDRNDLDHMEEELGDVLLQVVMHAQIAAEGEHFDFDSVCRVVNEKLIRRHPHVFGQGNLTSSEAVIKQWDQIKAQERKRGPKQTGRFKDLPRQLPALMFAQDVFKQLRKQGIDASAVIAGDQIDALSKQLGDEAAVGKQLFELAAACREQGIDPESALRRYTQAVVDQLEAELPAHP